MREGYMLDASWCERAGYLICKPGMGESKIFRLATARICNRRMAICMSKMQRFPPMPEDSGPGTADWWNLTPAQAIALQKELAQRIIREDRFGEVHTISGVDMAINEQNGMARAAVVLLSFPAMEM